MRGSCLFVRTRQQPELLRRLKKAETLGEDLGSDLPQFQASVSHSPCRSFSNSICSMGLKHPWVGIGGLALKLSSLLSFLATESSQGSSLLGLCQCVLDEESEVLG